MPVKVTLMMLAIILISITARAEADAPDTELLEFLADWETTDGQWVDPSSLDDASSESIKRKSDSTQTTQEEQDER